MTTATVPIVCPEVASDRFGLDVASLPRHQPQTTIRDTEHSAPPTEPSPAGTTLLVDIVLGERVYLGSPRVPLFDEVLERLRDDTEPMLSADRLWPISEYEEAADRR